MNSSYPPPSPCISPLPTPRSRGIKQGGLGLYTLPSTGLFQIPTGATHKERENLQRILQVCRLLRPSLSWKCGDTEQNSQLMELEFS